MDSNTGKSIITGMNQQRLIHTIQKRFNPESQGKGRNLGVLRVW